MVLVVYVCMQPTYPHPADYQRKNDVEASSQKHQPSRRIPHETFHAKHGYLDVRTRFLRPVMVETGLDYALFFPAPPASVLPFLRKRRRHSGRYFMHRTMYRSYRLHFSHGKCAEKNFHKGRHTPSNPVSIPAAMPVRPVPFLPA